MPQEFTQTSADKVCELIMDGYSLRKIEAETGIKRVSVMQWLRGSEAFQTQYARAREEQADAFIDEMHDISDDETKDVQHRKLQIDTRKWTASKLKPKKYGDKVDSTVVNIDGDKLTKEQRDAVFKSLKS